MDNLQLYIDADYKINGESWSSYQLEDGPIIRQKIILTRVLYRKEESGIDFRFKKNTITEVTHIPGRMIGAPSGPISPQELEEFIEVKNVRFEMIKDDWNEYEVVIENQVFIIKIRASATIIQRTSKFNSDGEPIYICRNSENIVVIPA